MGLSTRRLVRINLPSRTPIHPVWLCRSSVAYHPVRVAYHPVRALVASCQTGASTPQIGNFVLNSLLNAVCCAYNWNNDYFGGYVAAHAQEK